MKTFYNKQMFATLFMYIY